MLKIAKTETPHKWYQCLAYVAMVGSEPSAESEAAEAEEAAAPAAACLREARRSPWRRNLLLYRP